MVYAVLMYNFMRNEWAHVRDNPKVQFHKELIEEDEEDFIHEQKENYRTAQRKRRLEARKYLDEYREEKLAALSEEKRQKYADRKKAARLNMIFDEEVIFCNALMHQTKPL